MGFGGGQHVLQVAPPFDAHEKTNMTLRGRGGIAERAQGDPRPEVLRVLDRVRATELLSQVLDDGARSSRPVNGNFAAVLPPQGRRRSIISRCPLQVSSQQVRQVDVSSSNRKSSPWVHLRSPGNQVVRVRD